MHCVLASESGGTDTNSLALQLRSSIGLLELNFRNPIMLELHDRACWPNIYWYNDDGIVLLYSEHSFFLCGLSIQSSTHYLHKSQLNSTHYTAKTKFNFNEAPFSYRNNKLIFMNKNMLRFVKWVLRAYKYHRYYNGVNTGVFASKYKFGINNSTCETSAVNITTSSKRKSIIGNVME